MKVSFSSVSGSRRFRSFDLMVVVVVEEGESSSSSDSDDSWEDTRPRKAAR
jgi:hypothetical protein